MNNLDCVLICDLLFYVAFILLFPQSIDAVFRNIASTNVVTLSIGLVCTVFLYIIKDLNERFKKKLPIPIPGEIIVVKF